MEQWSWSGIREQLSQLSALSNENKKINYADFHSAMWEMVFGVHISLFIAKKWKNSLKDIMDVSGLVN